ncbi:hypothetical protein BG011_003517 [Mortierella polycephala]|uniref:Metal homeostatis protein bsd2 n=1 Tax=Mortierella polycephala TaxID=41804 RepID=A0A9P6U3V0_9FUNG|nr:hypothetical protein BG011_003517 [Mortierella polycephala]
MNRAHSYAQIPISENQDSNDPLGPASSSPSVTHDISLSATSSASNNGNNRKNNTNSRGYSALNDNDEDDDDDFENAGESSVMLRPMASTSSSASAPRHPVYPIDDNEISIAPPRDEEQGGASSSAHANNAGPNNASTSRGSTSSGPRTTNVSFLARLTGRQRPERDARIFVQSTMDGVFSNLSAKPRVEKPYEEELPPSYKSAALDVSPAYYETVVSSPGYMDEDDILVDGLPVGGLFGFMWNMIISMSFQFVGFFLTYLLHTSHSTKNGSKAGLGVTFVSMGIKILNGNSPLSAGASTGGYDDNDDAYMDSNTGYMGNQGSTANSGFGSLATDYMWLSYLFVILGAFIMIQSLVEFARAKRTEMIMNATSSAALEATVSADAAAGAGDEGSAIPTAPTSAAVFAAILASAAQSAHVSTVAASASSNASSSSASRAVVSRSESGPGGRDTTVVLMM